MGDLDSSRHDLDRMVHVVQSRFTGGLSVDTITMAALDWAVHLADSPGTQMQLWRRAVEQVGRLALYASRRAVDKDAPACIRPTPGDRRFDEPEWRQWPFDLIYQAFLLTEQWWAEATTSVEGVSKAHGRQVSFAARQVLDVFSPSNFLLTNPHVIARTVAERGWNLLRGAATFAGDVVRDVNDQPPAGTERFQVGRDVAVTPGKVILRNHLVELIQYSPSTPTVHADPVLIVPAWIMKYYILDLSPHNSLVRYLVDSGHTVFVVSWRNPGSEDRDLGMPDYRKLGVLETLDAVQQVVPGRRVHAVGYCLGGTLLAVAAAALARDGDDRLASLTLLAAQTDFDEPGELDLFIDEDQVSLLEDQMWERGYLDGKQMAGAFQMLRSRDLLWSRMVRQQLLGEPERMNDLMAWNADTTRLPFRMHSQYLRRMFLNDDLTQGRYTIDDKPVALSDIRAPMFIVGTERDHVSPWRSVYKLHLFADTDLTFLLTSGGHNAGIVSEPGHPRRHYRVATHHEGERYVGPETWQRTNPIQQGSWWPVWQSWLAERSGENVPPPTLGGGVLGPLDDAPGTYVHER